MGVQERLGREAFEFGIVRGKAVAALRPFEERHLRPAPAELDGVWVDFFDRRMRGDGPYAMSWQTPIRSALEAGYALGRAVA